MNLFKLKAWSPYAAGILIGLLQIPAFLIIQSPLGASSAYVTAAAYTGSVVDSNIHDNKYFDKHMGSKKYAWQTSMVIGIAFGALLSRRLSGAKRKAFSPIWTSALGLTTLTQRMLIAFAGGFLLLFGARWAGGCTSGHGLSGVGQLGLGSIIATAMFFVGGIAVAKMFRKV